MSDDPLRHADIGETKTIERDFVSYPDRPRVFHGSDRVGDAEIEDVDVQQLDDGTYELHVKWAGDVTKTLPERWDYCKEPRTNAERKQERRRSWKRRVARIIGVALPSIAVMGVATFFTHRIMRSLSGELTMNGEAITYSFLDMVPVLALTLIIAAIIGHGVHGGFPGKIGGHR